MHDFDLNLLRVFDALMELHSVTKVAHRLGLTQSAVSHALGRLRQNLGDPLFVRSAGGLQPTARAIEIMPGVRDGLSRLQGALAPSLFDPATSTRRFNICAGSYFCVLAIPRLIVAAREIAPHVSFRIAPSSPEVQSQLDDGTVDIALGAFGRTPQRLDNAIVGAERFVWIVRADNPILGAADRLTRLARAPRVAIAGSRPFPGVGAFATNSGLERSISVIDIIESKDSEVTVYDSVTAALTVASTDMVALLPERLARNSAASMKLAVIPADNIAETMNLSMLWHRRAETDAGNMWLRALIQDVLKGW